MLIVVEGPDGSGKTSLIERLQASLPDLELRARAVGSDTAYRTPLDQWVINEREAYDRAEAEGDCDFIYDRHQLISHLIYGPLMRRTLFESFTNIDWLYTELRQFWRRQPIIIICLPPLEAVVQNMADDPYKVENIEVYYWYYHAWLAMNYTYPSTYRDRMILSWDFTCNDFDDLIQTINRLERAM